MQQASCSTASASGSTSPTSEDAEVLKHALLAALAAAGLEESVACLRDEAGIRGDSLVSADGALRALTTTAAALSLEDASLLRRGLAGCNPSSGLPKAHSTTSYAHACNHLRTQRDHVETLQKAVRSMHKHLERGTSSRGGSKTRRPDMVEQLSMSELALLKRRMDAMSAKETEVDERLQEAQAQLEILKATIEVVPCEPLANGTHATHAEVAEAPPRQEEQVDVKRVLDAALSRSSEPGGLKEKAHSCFKEACGKSPTQLSWEAGEVQRFVTSAFQRYGLGEPGWSDVVWGELRKTCELEAAEDIDFLQAYSLLRHCFELRIFDVEMGS
eukprot:TRINITY_DN27024_c0_g1_i1.p1 TRINITY_DN27024_c0_g1~~TRINITY_DN27024_c0_g1_i1.p1  ORF type:complete len:330 (+),score=90.54 TRINITY_DN27024_c0_g1_i1:115-1104(+)